MGRAAPCPVGSRRRTARAVAATVALVAVVALPPAGAAVALRRLAAGGGVGDALAALGDGAVPALARDEAVLAAVALALACAWVPVAAAVVGALRAQGRAARPARLVPAPLGRGVARLVEAGLFGAGTLRGWTRTRVDASLADLQVPPARRPPPPADPPAPPPARRDERLRRGVRRVRKAATERRPSVPAGVNGWAGRDLRPPLRPPPGAAASPPPAAPAPATTYVAERGDTWWGLAERFLGDGRRFAELKERNAGRHQPDGAVVRPDRPLRAGWIVEVPVAGAGESGGGGAGGGGGGDDGGGEAAVARRRW